MIYMSCNELLLIRTNRMWFFVVSVYFCFDHFIILVINRIWLSHQSICCVGPPFPICRIVKVTITISTNNTIPTKYPIQFIVCFIVFFVIASKISTWDEFPIEHTSLNVSGSPHSLIASSSTFHPIFIVRNHDDCMCTLYHVH